MQTMLLIALGLISGTAVITGALGLAIYPPAFLKRPLLADPLDRPDSSDGLATNVTTSETGGSDSHC